MVLLVEETIVPLSLDKTVRVPYGRDLTVLVDAEKGAAAVTVRYEFSGGKDGPRSGNINAVADKDGTCWSAAMPKVHLNETGAFTAVIARSPKFIAGVTAESFAGSFIVALAALPSRLTPEDYARAAAEAATKTIGEAFVTPAADLAVQADGGEWKPFATRLSEMVASEIQFANVVFRISNAAGQLSRALNAIVAANPDLQLPPVAGCRLATTPQELLTAADALKDHKAAADSIVAGAVPWDPCARDLVSGIGAGSNARRLTQAVDALVNPAQLQEVRLLASKVQAILREVANVKTIEVPLGADLLERYTQVDVVSAYLPSENVAQAFTAATWYFFNPQGDFTAKTQPTGLGAQRFGLQVGYPIGALSEEEGAFEPDVLVGLIGRVNGVLSLSAGVVFGKRGSGKTLAPGFISFNVDLSNLGPLKEVFSRPDK